MIGVIGGAGVAATNKLCELIEEKMTESGAFRDAHHPEMLIWQATKVPSRSMYYEGRGETFIPDYIDIGKKMKRCGVTKIAMCCNTAHMAIDEIEDAVGLPFINIMQEVGKVIRGKCVHKVGIMCSDSLAKSKFYDQYITDNNKSLKIVYPADGTAALVAGTGIAYKAKAADTAAAKEFADWLLSDEAQQALQKQDFYFVPTNPGTMAYKSFAGKNMLLFDQPVNFTAQQRHDFLDRWVKEVRFK